MKGRVKGSTFEDGVRVPFLVAGPGLPYSFESDALVHVTDLIATIADLTGAEVPEGAAPDSISFAQSLFGPGQGRREHLISDYVPRMSGAGLPGQPRGRDRAVLGHVEGRLWKLRRKGDLVEQLYDLAADPRERNPLDRADPRYEQVLVRLRAWLDAHEDSG